MFDEILLPNQIWNLRILVKLLKKSTLDNFKAILFLMEFF